MFPAGHGTYESSAAVREFIAGWWATRDERHHYIEETRDVGRGVDVTSYEAWPSETNERRGRAGERKD